MPDPYNDPEFRAFAKRVRKELIPKLKDSRITLSLVPDVTDVKFAVELGMSIMLDKPIIAVVRPGTKIPAKLAAVVDRFVEGSLDDEHSGAKLAEAINAVMEELEKDD